MKELAQGCIAGRGGTAIGPLAPGRSILGSQGQNQAPHQQAGGHSGDLRRVEKTHLSLFLYSRAAAELEAAGDYVKVGGTAWGLAML